MKTMNIPNYTVEELSRQLDPHGINNFIVSDNERRIPAFLMKYPHTLEGIVFSICVRGKARFKINMQEFTIKPNAVATILPNTIIEPIERSDDFFLETLLFSFDFIADSPITSYMDILEKIEQNPCLYVSDDERQNLLKFHTFIMEQYNRKDHQQRKEIAKCLLFALIAEIGSLYSTVENSAPKQTRAEKQTSSFFALLRKHYKEERNVAFYADKLCLTPKYLTYTIKKSTGKSVPDWIHEAVISAAKVLLKSSDKTILQISDELNFSDASQFCRFFRKYVHTSPKQYRESDINMLIP